MTLNFPEKLIIGACIGVVIFLWFVLPELTR